MIYKHIQNGFTLVEMAVVLVIFGLVVGGLLGPLTAQIENQRRSETKLRLETARDALYGYTITNGYMPCPDRTSGGAGTTFDTANDGIEDYSAGTGLCAVQIGNLPWSTLALVNSDDWGQAIIYSVTSAFSARTPAATFSITSTGNQRVCNDAACTAPVLTSTAAAVLLSMGPNAGACQIGTCADEVENTDGDADFVSHTPSANGVSGTEYFDDMVLWISPSVLISKMVTAGRLP